MLPKYYKYLTEIHEVNFDDFGFVFSIKNASLL